MRLEPNWETLPAAIGTGAVALVTEKPTFAYFAEQQSVVVAHVDRPTGSDGLQPLLAADRTGASMRAFVIDGRTRFVKRSLNDGEKVKIAAIDPDFV